MKVLHDYVSSWVSTVGVGTMRPAGVEAGAVTPSCTCGWHGGTYGPDVDGEMAAFEEWESRHFRVHGGAVAAAMLLRDPDTGGWTLAGRPVHDGDVLELTLADGHTVRVSYLPSLEGTPGLRVEVAAGADGTAAGYMDVPAGAELRWPHT